LKDLRVDVYVKPGKYFAEHYDVLVMEGTHVKQLVGKSLRRLRMRLHDVAFHGLRSIIGYQVGKYGKKVVLVNPRHTSKTCARCGRVKEDLTLADRVFTCPSCGFVADRDYNASLNTLRRSGWERQCLWGFTLWARRGFEAGSPARKGSSRSPLPEGRGISSSSLSKPQKNCVDKIPQGYQEVNYPALTDIPHRS
jgi:transposase